jgi:hypothetical protein
MMPLAQRLVSHWFVLVTVSYVTLWALQVSIIMPLETLALENSTLVSILFLPHAARVLSTWMLGPKVLFSLVPSSILCYALLMPESETMTLTDVALASTGALCAPVAFELMRVVKINVYPTEVGVISWRTLVFAGFLSSILNSFFQTLFLEGKFPIQDTFSILTRFIIGDVLGLVVVLLMLVGLLRVFRGYSNV